MKHKESKGVCSWWGCCGGGQSGLFWGTALVLVGLYVIAKDAGWISVDIPFWGIVFVLVGAHILFKNWK